MLAELARLNAEYEGRFGFRFVVFVDRRPKAEILDVLRRRIQRPREEELDTAVGELVAIAEDRWRRLRSPRVDYTTDWLDLSSAGSTSTAAIVWIGTSFYFVALDNHCEPERERTAERGRRRRVVGDPRRRLLPDPQVPGRPAAPPKPLHWYKWEAYWTWLSGFALLCIVYYADARLRLIDPAVADLEPWQAILISIALLVAAWLVYDALCRVLADRPCAARAAMLGARHRDRVRRRAALRAARGVPPGRRDARDDHGRERPVRDHPRRTGSWSARRRPAASRTRAGIRGKQRSVHNNYLTLPVLFTMLAGHFSFTYTTTTLGRARRADGVGAAIRHYFNRRHAGETLWWIPVGCAARSRRSRSGSARPSEAGGGRGHRLVRPGPADRRDALRPLPLAAPDGARLHRRRRRRRARHARADPRAGRRDPGGRSRLDVHAARQRDAHDRRGARRARAMDRAGAKIAPCSGSPSPATSFAARLEEELSPARSPRSGRCSRSRAS